MTNCYTETVSHTIWPFLTIQAAKILSEKIHPSKSQKKTNSQDAAATTASQAVVAASSSDPPPAAKRKGSDLVDAYPQSLKARRLDLSFRSFRNLGSGDHATPLGNNFPSNLAQSPLNLCSLSRQMHSFSHVNHPAAPNLPPMDSYLDARSLLAHRQRQVFSTPLVNFSLRQPPLENHFTRLTTRAYALTQREREGLASHHMAANSFLLNSLEAHSPSSTSLLLSNIQPSNHKHSSNEESKEDRKGQQ